jgi:hypothetical protein
VASVTETQAIPNRQKHNGHLIFFVENIIDNMLDTLFYLFWQPLYFKTRSWCSIQVVSGRPVLVDCDLKADDGTDANAGGLRV